MATTLRPTASLTSKQLAGKLSARLANHKLSAATIQKLADRLMVEGLDIARFSPCIYGICIDYHSPKMPDLSRFTGRGASRFEVFPYGIIDWDHFHVKVGFEVPELEGKLTSHGMGL